MDNLAKYRANDNAVASYTADEHAMDVEKGAVKGVQDDGLSQGDRLGTPLSEAIPGEVNTPRENPGSTLNDTALLQPALYNKADKTMHNNNNEEDTQVIDLENLPNGEKPEGNTIRQRSAQRSMSVQAASPQDAMSPRSYDRRRHSIQNFVLSDTKMPKAVRNSKMLGFHFVHAEHIRRQDQMFEMLKDDGKHRPEDAEIVQIERTWLLEPRGRVMRWWDVILISLLIYTAILTPFEVAFLEVKLDRLYAVNRVVDFLFLVDIVINFNLVFYEGPAQRAVRNRRQIGWHYLTGWFTLDLVSILPFDSLGLTLQNDKVAQLKVLRIVRLLRLAKLLRILRAGRIIQRLEDSVPIDYGMAVILSFLLNTVVIAHWMACTWRLVPALEVAEVSWMTGKLETNGEEPASTSTLYAMSLYFAVYTLGSTGYGDIVPATNAERYTAACIMIIGAYFFGYVVGSITTIIAQRSRAKTQFYQSMDELNRFMENTGLPDFIRVRCRNYFRYNYHNNSDDWVPILQNMTPTLREQVVLCTSASWIGNLRLFKDLPGAVLVSIALSMTTQTYGPEEELIRVDEKPSSMFVVRQGVVGCQGQIFSKGGVVGEDMLMCYFTGKEIRRNFAANSLTFVVTLRLSRVDMEQVFTVYPAERRLMRRNMRLIFFKKEVLAYSRAVHHVLTGKRSKWSLLKGDPGSREEHYYQKLQPLTGADIGEQIRLYRNCAKIQMWWRQRKSQKEKEEALMRVKMKEAEEKLRVLTTAMDQMVQQLDPAVLQAVSGREGGSPFASRPFESPRPRAGSMGRRESTGWSAVDAVQDRLRPGGRGHHHHHPQGDAIGELTGLVRELGFKIDRVENRLNRMTL